MIKKSVFGRRDEPTNGGFVWVVVQYRLFGFLLYEKTAHEHLLTRAPQLV